MSEGLERAVGVGRGGEDQTAFAVATQTFLMLALLKLTALEPRLPALPATWQSLKAAWGTEAMDPAVQAA